MLFTKIHTITIANIKIRLYKNSTGDLYVNTSDVIGIGCMHVQFWYQSVPVFDIPEDMNAFGVLAIITATNIINFLNTSHSEAAFSITAVLTNEQQKLWRRNQEDVVVAISPSLSLSPQSDVGEASSSSRSISDISTEDKKICR